jgi:hypothetical protein
MFQYAAGRALAIRKNTILKFDLSGFVDQIGTTTRKYELNLFNIEENFAAPEEVAQIKKQDVLSHQFERFTVKIVRSFYFTTIFNYVYGKIMDAFFPHMREVYFREWGSRFNPNIYKTRDDAYLEGYWQSELYFKEIEDTLREEFTFKPVPSSENQELIEEINECESVGVHVRRGDYVTNPRFAKIYGNICTIAYYQQAIKLISEHVKSPHFYVFSDDINWVKDNLKINFPKTFVNFNTGEKSFEDLRLMSQCKHNVIANSSFSWWGAWLNNNKEKIVYAPRRWFNAPYYITRDVLPNSWVRI